VGTGAASAGGGQTQHRGACRRAKPEPFCHLHPNRPKFPEKLDFNARCRAMKTALFPRSLCRNGTRKITMSQAIKLSVKRCFPVPAWVRDSCRTGRSQGNAAGGGQPVIQLRSRERAKRGSSSSSSFTGRGKHVIRTISIMPMMEALAVAREKTAELNALMETLPQNRLGRLCPPAAALGLGHAVCGARQLLSATNLSPCCCPTI